EHAGQHHRLVGDETDRTAGDAAEARNNVLRKGRRKLEKIAFVHNLQDQSLDVVRPVRVIGDQRVERFIDAIGFVVGRPLGYATLIVGGQKVDQPAHLQQAFHVVFESAV